MRVSSPFRDRSRGFELKLTPLIDCVFLLLVYFIWSSSFVIAEKSLPSELSVAAGTAASQPAEPPPAADFDDLVVRVLWNGSSPAWQINGVPTASLADLRTTLTSIARIKSDAPLIVHPDPIVPLGDVIDVFDLSRLAGFSKVQFAAAAPPTDD
jgi:biopolymer transport protein ExbD